jgi:hypothetical protein
MPRPYSQVAQALQDLGSSVQSGFGQLSKSRTTAAQLALDQARTEHDIKKEEFLFPELANRRNQAIREGEAQAELDQPLDVGYAMDATFGPDNKDYELEHYFTNDIPGTYLKATGSTYNQETGQFTGRNGQTITRRQFLQNAPLYQSVILAKTDYIKKAQDALVQAKADGDNAKIVELNKFLNNPREHLKVYDQQEQALLEQKARYSQLPEGVVNTGFIDDAILRINRKKDELWRDIEFSRKLTLKQKSKTDALTQNQKALIWDKAHTWGESEIERMREDGSLTKKGVKTFLGIEYGEDQVPLNESEIQDIRRQITNKRYISDILVATGEDPRALNIDFFGQTPGTGKRKPGRRGKPATGKYRPPSKADIKAAQDRAEATRTPAIGEGTRGGVGSAVASSVRGLTKRFKKRKARFAPGGRLAIKSLKNKLKYGTPLQQEEARQELDKLREQGKLVD